MPDLNEPSELVSILLFSLFERQLWLRRLFLREEEGLGGLADLKGMCLRVW